MSQKLYSYTRCTGRCETMPNTHLGNPKYSLGEKYCAICQVCIITELLRCDCCGLRIRGRRRMSDHKAQLLSKKGGTRKR